MRLGGTHQQINYPIGVKQIKLLKLGYYLNLLIQTTKHDLPLGIQHV